MALMLADAVPVEVKRTMKHTFGREARCLWLMCLKCLQYKCGCEFRFSEPCNAGWVWLATFHSTQKVGSGDPQSQTTCEINRIYELWVWLRDSTLMSGGWLLTLGLGFHVHAHTWLAHEPTLCPHKCKHSPYTHTKKKKNNKPLEQECLWSKTGKEKTVSLQNGM